MLLVNVSVKMHTICFTGNKNEQIEDIVDIAVKINSTDTAIIQNYILL